MDQKARKPSGFAHLKLHNPQLLHEIASKGGKAAHAMGRAHLFTSEEAKAAGAKGGKACHANKRARETGGQVEMFGGDDE